MWDVLFCCCKLLFASNKCQWAGRGTCKVHTLHRQEIMLFFAQRHQCRSLQARAQQCARSAAGQRYTPCTHPAPGQSGPPFLPTSCRTVEQQPAALPQHMQTSPQRVNQMAALPWLPEHGAASAGRSPRTASVIAYPLLVVPIPFLDIVSMAGCHIISPLGICIAILRRTSDSAN